jgi:hypothetical protein
MNNTSTLRATFRAAKSRSQGRKGWCIIFNHPLRRNSQNKPIRVRRGLSTRDEQEADRLVVQMNHLLNDRSYWTASARQRASRELDPRVVSIFYDTLEAKSPENERPGKIIPLRF